MYRADSFPADLLLRICRLMVGQQTPEPEQEDRMWYQTREAIVQQPCYEVRKKTSQPSVASTATLE